MPGAQIHTTEETNNHFCGKVMSRSTFNSHGLSPSKVGRTHIGASSGGENAEACSFSVEGICPASRASSTPLQVSAFESSSLPLTSDP